MKKILIVLSTLILSLLAMIPINNSYSKDVNPWMSKVSDDTRIIDMSIPGTHDAGATHSLFDVAGKCQDLTIKQQLNVGTRFFDLRLQLVGDEFNIVHSFVDQSLKFKSVLKDLTSFVKEYNTEFIIISIKQDASSKNNARSFEEVLLDNLKEYEDIISFSKNLPNTVKDARGKIHIISRYNLDFGYPAYSGWSDDATFTLGNLYVQDNYCLDNIEEKKQDILSTINVSNSKNNDKLVLNFTSCYLENAFPPTYAGTAALGINPWFIDYINEHGDDKLGIVVADFIHIAYVGRHGTFGYVLAIDAKLIEPKTADGYFCFFGYKIKFKSLSEIWCRNNNIKVREFFRCFYKFG